jgi:hypothetical protein
LEKEPQTELKKSKLTLERTHHEFLKWGSLCPAKFKKEKERVIEEV